MDIYNVLDKTDWTKLAQQKRVLVDTLAVVSGTDAELPLTGLLNWIDAIQDAAAHEGFPVIWLTAEPELRSGPEEEI